ncbi:MAG: NAD-dependent deacylase [Rhodospirillum sp.]|nr:NAD-dependent deacylase [Rhodospirillum sp.]MCF8487871.1 NAD-dependent deacylase [Rhodospirillum sp.]MCF8499193.1 NAD-dependent deacylase [Rhodospirillum sp.]
MRPDLDPEDPIVILTGAGISKESGLDTFRDADGLWKRVRLEDVATPEGFARDPDRVHDFYNARRRTLLETDVVPNAAHEALVRLERGWPGGLLLVTQNIDDLHERAGSSPEGLIHMHGELFKVRCGHCGVILEWRADLSRRDPCPVCGRPAGLRPHVVWFGEIPLEMERIERALIRCGLFLSIGTSGTIYPAAGFVQIAKLEADAHTVELNLEPGEGSTLFDQHVHDVASRAVPAFVDRLLAGL